MAKVEPRLIKALREGTETDAQTIKGKIVEFAWQLKKKNYSEETIKSYRKNLMILMRRGADLNNPDSVEEVIACQEWCDGTKAVVARAYAKYAQLNGIPWNPPKYKAEGKLPFIPLEREIDALIAGCGPKMSALLQLLKETGMRIGEALRLKWTDVDTERHVITVNTPEKHGCPRQLRVSGKLEAMLNRLPKKNEFVFGGVTPQGERNNFYWQRRRLAAKLGNPRLLQIHFHTFRHWKATVEYHKTRSILHVKQLLGHKSIDSTIIYTHLVDFESDEFNFATAKTVEEAGELIKTGFEYVCHHEGVMLFRKRK